VRARVGARDHGAVLPDQLVGTGREHEFQIGAAQRRRMVRMERHGDVGGDHFAGAALGEKFDRRFAERDHFRAVGTGIGAQERESVHPVGRLARRLHGDHPAHGGAAEHQRNRMLAQQRRCHGRDAVFARVRVADHRLPASERGELVTPHRAVAGQARQEDQCCHEDEKAVRVRHCAFCLRPGPG
jgi:hypothetical protein